MTLITDLLLTIFTELAVCCFLGIRDKSDLLLITAMNMITNPLLHVLLFIFYRLTHAYLLLWIFTLLMEIFVVIVEAFLIRTDLGIKKGAFRISLYLNLSSFTVGLLSSYMSTGKMF